jgi:hypothetical protein
MRKILILASALSLLALGACASLTTNTGAAFTPAQVAHLDYTLSVAGVNDVAAMAKAVPAAKVSLQAGAAIFVSGVEGALASLTSGGTAADQAETAAATALGTAATQLNTIVGTANGTSANLAALATAGGVEAGAQLPATVATFIALQNGYQPSAADLTADAKALDAANTALQAE